MKTLENFAARYQQELTGTTTEVRRYKRSEPIEDKTMNEGKYRRVEPLFAEGLPSHAIEAATGISGPSLLKYRHRYLAEHPGALCRCGKPLGHLARCSGHDTNGEAPRRVRKPTTEVRYCPNLGQYPKSRQPAMSDNRRSTCSTSRCQWNAIPQWRRVQWQAHSVNRPMNCRRKR